MYREMTNHTAATLQPTWRRPVIYPIDTRNEIPLFPYVDNYTTCTLSATVMCVFAVSRRISSPSTSYINVGTFPNFRAHVHFVSSSSRDYLRVSVDSSNTKTQHFI